MPISGLTNVQRLHTLVAKSFAFKELSRQMINKAMITRCDNQKLTN